MGLHLEKKHWKRKYSELTRNSIPKIQFDISKVQVSHGNNYADYRIL